MRPSAATTRPRSASIRSCATRATRSSATSSAARRKTATSVRTADRNRCRASVGRLFQGRRGITMQAADRTLTLDLANVVDESRRLAAAIKPGRERWDVIVVGSGAAGGMAAYQLAMAGIKVLLLEAGRLIDERTEYRTMEWPYASMRRNRLPPGERPIAVAEYNFLDRPYGNNPAYEKSKKVLSYSGNTFTRNWVVDERQHPTTGTPYAWVRARVLGGRTNFWGRGALRYGPLQFNAASRDGFDVDWPISYDDVKPDRKSTRLNSSHVEISYAVFCLKKKKKKQQE